MGLVGPAVFKPDKYKIGPFHSGRHMNRTLTDYIVVHCSATPASRFVDAKEIRHWHIVQRGFTDIGYHLVILRDGTVELGRPLDAVGAHAIGFNHSSVAVCLVGGINDSGRPEFNYTPNQMSILRILLDGLQARYPTAKILGHCDLPGVHKACPSFNVQLWLDEGIPDA